MSADIRPGPATPTPEQVQALAEVLWVAGVERPVDLELQAHSVLASDWLRDRIATERADAARQALAPVLALADEWRATQGGPGAYGDGARGAYRQAAAQLTRAAAGGGEGQ